jgi:uncharacterized protein (TIGR02147 family)
MPIFDLNIYAYTDFRKYLGDYYLARKKAEKKFSHRFIQEHVGAGSAGWFADVVKGRTSLAGAQAIKLAHLFKLKPTETDYFESMVFFGQAGSLEERNRYFQKMMAFKEVRADMVGMDRLEFYSKWYHGAVRELLFFYPFRGDYAELARKLSPPIRQAEARDSVSLLERLGMVEPNGRGGYRSKEAVLQKDPSFPSVVMANFMKSNMELAIEALDRYSKDERDISALTISFSDEAFGKVKEEIRALRKKMLALTEVDTATRFTSAISNSFPFPYENGPIRAGSHRLGDSGLARAYGLYLGWGQGRRTARLRSRE